MPMAKLQTGMYAAPMVPKSPMPPMPPVMPMPPAMPHPPVAPAPPLTPDMMATLQSLLPAVMPMLMGGDGGGRVRLWAAAVWHHWDVAWEG